MPELPEVETVRRGLERLVKGKEIEKVDVRYAKMIGTGADAFVLDLPGQSIDAVGRRGKYLIFYLTNWVLISHLRMEGKYLFYPEEAQLTKHSFHRWQQPRLSGCSEIWHDGVVEKRAINFLFYRAKAGTRTDRIRLSFTTI